MNEVPNGIVHMKFLDSMIDNNLLESSRILGNYYTDMELIGTSLSVFYQAATCHRNCHGGNHVFEALCGRIYNLGSSSYSLLRIGLYDESLNLIRSIGEISNLIALSAVDSDAIREWLAADKKERLNKFGPTAIRKRLEPENMLLVGQDWYSEFCEKYTHVTPVTKPNEHGEDGPMVGGVVGDEGTRKSIDQLTYVLSVTAILVCRFFDFDDLFSDIEKLLYQAKAEQEKS